MTWTQIILSTWMHSVLFAVWSSLWWTHCEKWTLLLHIIYLSFHSLFLTFFFCCYDSVNSAGIIRLSRIVWETVNRPQIRCLLYFSVFGLNVCCWNIKHKLFSLFLYFGFGRYFCHILLCLLWMTSQSYCIRLRFWLGLSNYHGSCHHKSAPAAVSSLLS